MLLRLPTFPALFLLAAMAGAAPCQQPPAPPTAGVPRPDPTTANLPSFHDHILDQSTATYTTRVPYNSMPKKKLVAGEPRTIPPHLLLSHGKSTPSPVFPKAARDQKQDGTVVIALEVGLDGKVTRTMPLSGAALLVADAEKAVNAWVFEPFTIKGVPQIVRSAVQFDFRWRGSGTRVLPE